MGLWIKAQGLRQGWTKISSVCLMQSDPHFKKRPIFRSIIFLHFAPIRSVVQNPHCHFSMNGPMGSFSPVQGDMATDSHTNESSDLKH